MLGSVGWQYAAREDKELGPCLLARLLRRARPQVGEFPSEVTPAGPGGPLVGGDDGGELFVQGGQGGRDLRVRAARSCLWLSQPLLTAGGGTSGTSLSLALVLVLALAPGT